jgi:hypothetical protein
MTTLPSWDDVYAVGCVPPRLNALARHDDFCS